MDTMEVFKKHPKLPPVLSSATSAIPTNLPTFTQGPHVEYQKAGHVGTQTLWVVFVVMLISSLAFYIMAFRVPVQKRLFHILTAFITTFAALSYYAMAIKDGVGENHIHLHHHNKHHEFNYDTVVVREVYWARYVDWSVTTPLLLLDLAFLAGLPGANILVAIVADVVMILTGLFAAFTVESSPKWGWYAMACLAYLVIIWQLGFNGRGIVQNKDKKTATFFGAIGGFTLILWTIYPIVWGVADGSRNVSVDGEIIAYAVLDILAKPVFGFWLLFTHDSLSNSASIEGFWAHGLSKEGSLTVGEDDDGA